MRKHKTVEKASTRHRRVPHVADHSIPQVIASIRMEGSLDVPKDYVASFQLAELVFLHQRVYCPVAKRLVTLLPLPDGGLDEVRCRYIGQWVGATAARAT